MHIRGNEKGATPGYCRMGFRAVAEPAALNPGTTKQTESGKSISACVTSHQRLSLFRRSMKLFLPLLAFAASVAAAENPSGGEVLYNGIVLPRQWPPTVSWEDIQARKPLAELVHYERYS